MKPGDMYNKFQAMKKKAETKKCMPKMKKKNWIASAIKKPGALHAQLGVPQGKKIPAKTLAKAAKKGGKEGKRARLAETLKGLKHKTKKKVGGFNVSPAQGVQQNLKPGVKGGNIIKDIKSDVKGVMDRSNQRYQKFLNRPNNSDYYGSFKNKKTGKKK